MNEVATKRSYGDRCGIARALDVAGERWALLVVRELMLGPKRFTDLQAGLPRIGPDVLAQRLRELEGAGVVQRRTLAPPAASRVYELTGWGRELEPVLLALGRWGSRAPAPAGAPLGVDAFVLALPTLFDAQRATGVETTVELRIGADRFALRVDDGRLDVQRGAAEPADAVLEAEPAVLSQVLWHGRDVGAAERAGELAIGGSRRAARRFLRLFPPPVPAAGAERGR